MLDQIGSRTPVRESSWFGTPSSRLKPVWYPQCAAQLGLAPPVRVSNLSYQSPFLPGSADQSRLCSGWPDQSWLVSRISSWVMINAGSWTVECSISGKGGLFGSEDGLFGKMWLSCGHFCSFCLYWPYLSLIDKQ